MYGDDPEDVFYYVTLYNETYPMPRACPTASRTGSSGACTGTAPRRLGERRPLAAQILASGTTMLAALEAQRLLADDHEVAADVWSATSYKLLREDALVGGALEPACTPPEARARPYVTEQLGDVDGPIVAVTDFVKAVPDQIARLVPQPFVPLGTDGYGFSDTREALRRHFEVDAAHIVVAVLDGLAMTGAVTGDVVAAAIERYGIDPELPDPRLT